jgi:hypothetical protein
MGVEHRACVDGMNSPIRDFVGPIVPVGHCGCHDCDSGVILVKSYGNGVPTQEHPPQSLPAGVLPIRVWSRLLLMRLLFLLFSFLNSKGDF